MAGNELTASFNWTDNQLAHLGFSRNDKPIAFTEHEIDLTFKDPRGNGEIQKILLDPQYRPGNASNADFWVETTITSPVSNRKVSETALCYWNNDKSVAVGSIEDDGGRIAIVAESVTDALKTSRLSFLVVPMSGYTAFRIAEDVPVGNDVTGTDRHRSKAKEPHAGFIKDLFPTDVGTRVNRQCCICAAGSSENIWHHNRSWAHRWRLWRGDRIGRAHLSIPAKHYSRWDCWASDVVGSGRS